MQDLLQGPNNKPAWSNLNALSLNCDSLTCTNLTNTSNNNNYILVNSPAIPTSNATTIIGIFTTVTSSQLSVITLPLANPPTAATATNQCISGFVPGRAYKVIAVLTFLNPTEVQAGSTINLNISYTNNANALIENLIMGQSSLPIIGAGPKINISYESFFVAVNADDRLQLNNTVATGLPILMNKANITDETFTLSLYCQQLN